MGKHGSTAPRRRATELALPPRLQEKIKSRIRGLALIVLVIYAVALAFLVTELFQDPAPSHQILRIAGLLILIVLCALVLRPLETIGEDKAILYALAVQWFICLFVSITNPTYELLRGGILPGVTWVVPIIIMFPLLIPTPPPLILKSSIACVMTVPIGTIISYYMAGQPDVNLATAIPVGLISPVVGAAIANIGAPLVYEMGAYAKKSMAGNYKLSEKIGEGGMGVVYQAMHTLLKRPAAIKFILPERLEDRFGSADIAKQRFEREAAVLTQLRSAHTVEIYDYGIDDQGRFYYVMELLDGWDLWTLVNKFKAVPPARAAHLMAQLCESLGEAHDLGFVHRDVKPSNIMTCRYGREIDFVKVLDFGLMIPRTEESELAPGAPHVAVPGPIMQTRLTRGTRAMGTPSYMSPEQIQRKTLDGRSDIYAVGCVAFWLLTAQEVFGDGTEEERRTRHLEDAPPRLSQVATQAIPARLEEIVLSCLAKDPNRRPQDADKLAKAFESSAGSGWHSARAWWTENTPGNLGGPISRPLVTGDD